MSLRPCEISAESARSLRGEVLRPGQPVDRLVYPGDDDPGTVHLGVREDNDDSGRFVSVASLSLEPLPERVDENLCGVAAGSAGVRVRGMATLPEHRGKGFGGALVEHGLRVMRGRHGDRLPAWCNARTSAARYYEKIGFVISSDEFVLPEIGLHAVMVRSAR